MDTGLRPPHFYFKLNPMLFNVVVGVAEYLTPDPIQRVAVSTIWFMLTLL